MNYPCFDFPIDVSHEMWLLSPFPNSILALLLTVVKKQGSKTKKEKTSGCHKGRETCVSILNEQFIDSQTEKRIVAKEKNKNQKN